ncbi:endolytic transglycosylase MltG [Microbacterium sp. VKM Ac-2870]|uniref:endolytic transglycosylase MltG n=1 Tax=Microbacterium sp. VKM Ac-2870 TaxID=2783825 RepID=UPI00188D9AE4|nr:endolytic transglycosylase MltG [Microbacterium sp. VKM Ac-2870]MBF4560930.1 endolytic transglycosylase MltG [Microbacterium sp. VKM Ac-2870]
MPESPPNDDEFADLFRKLPTPRATGASAGEAEPATPPSRRAAREAAAAAAGSSEPAPTPAAESVPATTAAAEPAERPVPATAEPVPAVPAPMAAPPAAPAEEPAAPAEPAVHHQIDALFAAEERPERARSKKHDPDRRKSRIAGWVVFGVILAIIGGLVGGGFYAWNTYGDKIRSVMGWEEPKDYEDGIAEGDASVTIVTGDTGATISTTLFQAGVTKTDSAFYDYLVKTGQNPTFQPGVYTLKQKMSSAAAVKALEDPANRRENTAQLPEGLTMASTLTRIADGTGIPLADLQAAAADPSQYGVSATSLEGWLFPATYTFDPGTTATQVIKTLVDRTITSLDKAGVPADQRERILTVASIIQREARFTADFYKVSRVIENRLDPDNEETHGLLQMDSTAQYGYNEMNKGTASSSAEALANDNPWNTYIHPGLPVGPIANPGDVAIDAAMHPADGPWLYFVTVNLDTGETVFSTTYAEHEKAVAQWQQWCSANASDDC